MDNLCYDKEDFFNRIYTEMSPKIKKYIFKLVRNSEVAEDVTQETFIEFYKKINQMIYHDNIIGWLYVTYKFKLYKNLEKKDIFWVEYSDIADRYSMNKDFENRINEFLLYRDIMGLLKKDDYEIFILHFKYGYKFCEVAEMKNIDVGTCKMRFYRIIQKLGKIQ